MTYISDSVDLLKVYQPAVDVLGLPIKANKINDKDPFNQIEMKKVQVSIQLQICICPRFSLKHVGSKVKVPIEGKKRLADLMVYASREDDDKL